LLAIAVGEMTTTAPGNSLAPSTDPEAATHRGADLPADDYLDQLAGSVLNRA
jgi:hypothetical protein